MKPDGGDAVLAIHPRADHEVVARPGRLEQAGEILRIVLAVGVDEGDVARVASADVASVDPSSTTTTRERWRRSPRTTAPTVCSA